MKSEYREEMKINIEGGKTADKGFPSFFFSPYNSRTPDDKQQQQNWFSFLEKQSFTVVVVVTVFLWKYQHLIHSIVETCIVTRNFRVVRFFINCSNENYNVSFNEL